ncbi:TOMM precursor leader peptide-binding protein [Micromonospora sp. MW-13]|uniref:TOMM precursor leader peptide-binding protein n=1 Tax=Micromonospora sp. MW-13 TaxID=2094022 RepID=UPI000FFEB48E|nr:TOMM precursor leader peptide-binding protein [Micromonospora sp. MW-13]
MGGTGVVTLRPGSIVRPVEGGLFVGGWRSSALVTAPPVAGELWRRLEPLVREGIDPETAIAGRSARTAAAVRWLFGLLAEHDLLVDARLPLDGHPLAAYLAGVAGDPAGALAAVRQATVAVTGGPGQVPAVRAALRASGVAVAGDAGPDADLTVLIRTGTGDDPPNGGGEMLAVTVRPDGALIGPPGRPTPTGPGAPADRVPAPVGPAHRLLPYLVVHEVVRALGGLADDTALLLRGGTVRRVGTPAADGDGGVDRPERPDPGDVSVLVRGDDGPLVEAVRAAAPIRSTGTPHRRPGRVVVVGAAPDWPVARHLAEQRTAHATGAAYLPVRARGTSIEIGPLSRPDTADDACLQCADVRRRATLDTGDQRGSAVAAALVADGRPLPLPPYWQRLVAALAAGQLTGGVDPRTVGVLAVRDGSVTRHLVRPVPDCPACAALPPDSAAAARVVLHPRPLPAPDRLRRGAPDLGVLRAELVDLRYGPVTAVHSEREGPVALAAAELPVPGRSGRLGGYGRAADHPTAQVLALLEAVEREAGRYPQGRRTTVLGSYRELAADAVDPARLGLPEPDAVRHPAYPLDPYTPQTVTSWVWAHDLSGDRQVLVPEHAAYYGVRRPGAGRFLFESSSGCAVGSCLEEAVLHACLETIERDAFLLTWYTATPPTALTMPPDLDPVTRHLADRIAAEGYTLHLFDITSDVGVPVIWALLTADRADATARGATFSAAGAHPDPRRAVAAAVLEAGVNMAVAPRMPRPPRDRLLAMLDDPDQVRDLADHAALHLLAETLPRFDFATRPADPRPFDAHFAGRRDRWRHPDLTEVLRRLVDAMAAAGMPPLVVRQTGAAERRLGLTAVKVLAPGALPMTFGHLNRRVDLPRLRRRSGTGPGRPTLPHPFP